MRKSIRARFVGEGENVDMTPMLDIVFIMLIFFIVTTSFVKEAGLPIEPLAPAPLNPYVDPVSGLAVEITADNTVRIKGRVVDIALVSAYLEGLQAESPEEKVVVLASAASDAKTLVAVLDAVRRTGMDVVSVGRLE